ncbi:MAG TPA: M15 family metallopeptidase [Iamia sp.]|nr:M15 family metallopeptidase [Iamia sp.]
MTTTTTRRRAALGMIAISALIALGGAACQPETLPAPPGATPATTSTTPGATVPTPALTTVACPAGGSITVASGIATNVRNLLAAARADKLNLCGSAYRDSSRQVELRKQNCGTSRYDIWEKPASQCSPPTAIPGTSMHEKGMAIDFASCSTRTTACYRWLAANASRFGLRNLPSEPWHWSTNGRSRAALDHDHLGGDV